MPECGYDIQYTESAINFEQLDVNTDEDTNDLHLEMDSHSLWLYHLSFEEQFKDHGRGTRLITGLLEYCISTNLVFRVYCAYEPVQHISKKLAIKFKMPIKFIPNGDAKDIIFSSTRCQDT